MCYVAFKTLYANKSLSFYCKSNVTSNSCFADAPNMTGVMSVVSFFFPHFVNTFSDLFVSSAQGLEI